MKKIILTFMAVVVAGIFAGITVADTGYEGATRIERGSYVQSRAVAISSSSATLFLPPSKSRPDSLCKNYSAYTVFIGSNVAGTYLATIGLPVGASEYFKLDGSMTGPVYALGEGGSSGVEIRCLDGMVQ